MVFSWWAVWPLTSVTEEEAADPGQQRQSDEVSKAGGDGCGHIVRVDAHFPGTNDHCNHHQTWQSKKMKQHSKLMVSTVYCTVFLTTYFSTAVCPCLLPRDSAAMKAVLTLLTHRTAAWVTSTLPLVRPPRPTAATAARKPTTVAWTWARDKKSTGNLFNHFQISLQIHNFLKFGTNAHLHSRTTW